MPAFLEGLSIQFYRGIGPETQYIAPFSDMNFFVGANNAGKSVVLQLIAEHLPSGQSPKVENRVDTYRGPKEGKFHCLIGLGERTYRALLLEQLKNRFRNYRQEYGILLRIKNGDVEELSSEIANQLLHLGGIWVEARTTAYNPNIAEPNLCYEVYNKSYDYGLDTATWIELAKLFNLVRQSDAFHAAHSVLEQVTPSVDIKIPERLLIPAKRQLTEGDEAFDDLSGKGLIKHLAEIQNPDFDERDRKDLFDKINEFVQVVTGKPDALLEIPNHREHLIVHMDEKVLPLSSLGTGIHEVILIAAFCTIHQRKIICLEEPEIHLHPVLQRKLIRYLKDHTENQYFIATHSAAFIDTADASVFHVRNDGVQTYVEAAITKKEQRQICDDLGYRASDILQANAVIWVEGPSDRIYVRHWLKMIDDRLKEGVHYSIMFYGGGLMSHLSTGDGLIDDFINLRNLNRNFAVIIDSDKDNPRSKLKPAAKRLKDELVKDGGIVWITKGREIENYVPHEQLQKALKARHPKIYGAPCAGGLYDHSFYFERKAAKDGADKVYKSGDKVGAARIVCSQDATFDLEILDLKKRMNELVEMIAVANEMETL